MPTISEDELKKKLSALKTSIKPMSADILKAIGATEAPKKPEPGIAHLGKSVISQSGQEVLEKIAAKIKQGKYKTKTPEQQKKADQLAKAAGATKITIPVIEKVAQGVIKDAPYDIKTEVVELGKVGVAPSPEPPASPEVCFNKYFKELIAALPDDMIGTNGAKNMIFEILGTFPVCEEKPK